MFSKRINLFIVVFLLGICHLYSQSVYSRDTIAVKNRPRVAVVLSGGGAKGFAHIGVLKVLEEEGIPVDIIVGTSIGSLVGGIYALGYSADEIYHIAKTQKWDVLLTDDVPRTFLSKNDQLLRQRYLLSLAVDSSKKVGLPQGLIKGQNVMNLFCGVAGNVPGNVDFSKLPIPFACVAADLETGEEVVMTDGFLPTAMFSSMAIPALFQSPERNGRLLIDGGVVNNFPADVAKRMGADIIIGVDLQRDPPKRSELQSMTIVVSQLVFFLSKEKYHQNIKLCDVLLRPEVSDYSMLAFNAGALDSLREKGIEVANEYREEFQRLKAKYHLEPDQKSREYVVPEKWHIDQIRFHGKSNLDKSFLSNTFGLTLPGNYTYQEIKDGIDRIYGFGGFEKIYFDFTDGENGKTLNLNIIPQKVTSQNIGFKVNTTDAAALLLNISKKDYGKQFGYLSANLELSANPGFSVMAETNRRNLATLGLELKGKSHHINIFDEGRKAFNIDIFYTSAAVYLYRSFLTKYNVGLGLKEEFYRGDIFSKESYLSESPEKANYWVTNPYAYFSLDNLDNFYFPTKGTNLYTEFSIDTDLKKGGTISPTLLFRMNNVIPIERKTVLLADIYSRMLFCKDFPMAKVTLVGGEGYSQYFKHHLPFIGLPPVMFADRYVLIGSLGVRRRLSENRYLSLVLNEMLQSNEAIRNVNLHSVFGGGVKYSIKTVVGPLDVGVGYSDLYQKPTFSANLGFWF